MSTMNEIIGRGSTYRISSDCYSLPVFVYVNKVEMTEILGLCLHNEEKSVNFVFALKSYLLAGFACPKIIFTNRAKVLVKAIEDE